MTSEESFSAAQPDTRQRTLSPLSHLTKQSANFCVFEVVIFNPKATTREYLYNGVKRTQNQFQCMLVSTEDPTVYVLGDSHGRGVTETSLRGMAEKFKPGLVFQMSKVGFATNVRAQYNSAPKLEVVSMCNTNWTSVMSSAEKPRMPEPSIPIAQSMGIAEEQHFDALALVQDVSEMNHGGQTSTGQARVRCCVLLNDGSKSKEDGGVCHLPVTIFADALRNGEPPMIFSELENAAREKKAMAFFGIQGKKSNNNDGTWSFTSSFNFHCKLASETNKGRRLEENASELVEAQGEQVPPAQRSPDSNTSFANEEATETTCVLMQSILEGTDVAKIEGADTFWQINWCHVHIPDKNGSVTTNDHTRLWMEVKIEDETGCLSLWMREKAALSLSNTANKEEFESAWANDTLHFPQKASIKIIRKLPQPETPRAGGSSQGQSRVQCYIVEAGEQAMEDAPSVKSIELLKLLAYTEISSNACVPCGISMVHKDPHYGLAVNYLVEGDEIKKRCIKAVAVVVATTASVAKNLNDGFQMITEKVNDPLNQDFQCTLMSYCDVKNSPEFQLKPPRGHKTQTAFVAITDVLEEGDDEKPRVFLVESVERIEDNGAEEAAENFRKKIQFSALAAKTQGSSAKRKWTDEMSPAMAGKCRRLGKAPTDVDLEPYNFSG